MKIRKLNGSDAEKFRTLRLEALKEAPTAFGMSYEEFLEIHPSLDGLAQGIESPTGFIIGVFENDDLIGIAGVIFAKGVKRSHIAEIWGVYVTHSKRQQKIGRLLLEAIIESAREVECLNALNLSVNVENTSAIKLYEKFGFITWGQEVNALKVNNIYYDESPILWTV